MWKTSLLFTIGLLVMLTTYVGGKQSLIDPSEVQSIEQSVVEETPTGIIPTAIFHFKASIFVLIALITISLVVKAHHGRAVTFFLSDLAPPARHA